MGESRVSDLNDWLTSVRNICVVVTRSHSEDNTSPILSTPFGKVPL
jgi:hypothetical protein